MTFNDNLRGAKFLSADNSISENFRGLGNDMLIVGNAKHARNNLNRTILTANNDDIVVIID